MPHETQPLRLRRKTISIIILAALWFLGCYNLTWGDEEPLPEILILNSYHQGEDWSDNELAGILTTLKKRHPFLVPAVEHLDTKRFTKPEHLDFIRQYLQNKYRGKRFDLIFVLDNPALDLMTKARHELFPGIPVVLAGINGYTPEMIRGQDRIAGVAEVQDMAGTLKLALTLHPETKSVLVVHDYTASGLAVHRDMAAVADQFKNKVNIAYTPDGTVEELVAQLQSLPADALVLLLTYVTDNSGRSLTRTESTRLIANASPVPVYAMHETRLGHGVIGGMLLEGKEHGRQAADIALRILADKGAAQYVVEDSRSRPVFDYSQLVRFKVDLNKLPENSTLINQPVSFFQQHRTLLIPGLIVAVLLLMIIAILAFAVSRFRKTSNELARSEQKYRGLFENILDGLILVDPESHFFIDVNPAISKMTGYTTEEMNLLRVEDIHPQESLPHVLAQFAKQISGDITLAPGLPIKRKDGEVFYADVQAVPIQIQGRRLFLGVFRDITERKLAEEERNQLQTKLVQAQKMEAIGTLAGGIAHDFNNILGAIIGYTEIAIDSIAPDSIAINYLDKGMEASRRAAGLVKQILAFSRQTPTERVALQPAQMVREVIKLLRPSLPSTIIINQQVDSAANSILADPTQVHQILMNLSTNAYHAMEQTGGTLEITLKNCELSLQDLQHHLGVQPGHFVQLSVGDSGQGIAPEIRDKIFEPYFTTKEFGKGTGMGLAIVHGIVTGYGGFITCESGPRGGTVFHVFFPAIEEETGPLVKPVEAILSGGGRILLVDDEEILVDLGTTMLELLGFEVTARSGSLAALDIFKNQPDRFDAVITDQTMPDMTGMELARRMLEIRPDLPIILCTGYSSLVTEEQAKASGIKGFALKPLTKKEIAKHLSAVLNREEVRGA